jgi:cardiolipin synthase
LCGAILYHVIYQNLTMQPLLISKLNTTAQFALATSVLGLTGYSIADGLLIETLVYTVAATTVLSGAAYVGIWGIRAATMEPGE